MSVWVQALPSLHAVPLVLGEQVPDQPRQVAGAEHWSVQAVSQQTPLTQKPVAHWLFDVHPSPERGVVEARGADRRRPVDAAGDEHRSLSSSVAVCPWTAAGSAVVAVQVVVPFQSSALLSVLDAVVPPATSTVPFSITARRAAASPSARSARSSCCRPTTSSPC